MFKKKAEKPNPALQAQIEEKQMLTWSPEDVSNWLRACGFGEYSAKFLKHKISGQELMILSTADLRSVGVTALGHQKALLGKVQSITQKSAIPGGGAAAVTSFKKGSIATHSEDLSGDDRSHDEGSSSATSAHNRLELVCIYGTAKRSVTVKRTYTLERVLQRMEDEYTFPVELNVQGKNITEALDWADAIQRHNMMDPMEVVVTREPPNKIHKEEKAMLHGLTDACFVIDKEGTILFCNLMAETLSGYSSFDLVGQNVKMLTPPSVRVNHDSYLRRYIETSNAKVIGTGRQVQMIHKDGHEVSCWLSVTEQKKASGRHTFMGMLHEIKSRDTTTQTAKFAVLDGVQDAVVVINAQGMIQFVNNRTEKLLGYKADILGRNISQFMPEPYASAHDGYLRNYQKSGRPKIIGKGGRVVIALHHNGSLVPMQLEVDECVLEGQRFFVGLFQAKDSIRKKKITLIEKTRNVNDQLAVAGIVIDPKGVVHGFNAAAAQLLGYDVSEVLNKNVTMLMNDRDAKQHDEYLARYMSTGQSKIIGKFRNVVAKKKGGQELAVTLSLSRMEDPDDANNILFIGNIVKT